METICMVTTKVLYTRLLFLERFLDAPSKSAIFLACALLVESVSMPYP